MVVHMTGNAMWNEAIERVKGAEGELTLDFSGVARLDVGGVRAMEELAGLAGARRVRVVLRGVNVDIYRVLKALKLASAFGFDN
jgi:anti-anti-sigma regulatory factor